MDFITSGPLVAMVLEGESAIRAARQVIGATNPLEATTGSIRGDYAISVGQNMVHGSDAPESAAARGRAVLPRPRLGGANGCAAARLILASASPQRRAILEQIGVAFEVRVPEVDELSDGPAAEVALENAYRKAAAIGARADLPVLGVDTVVSLGRELFGKPRDAAHAAEMLGTAGRAHARGRQRRVPDRR